MEPRYERSLDLHWNSILASRIVRMSRFESVEWHECDPTTSLSQHDIENFRRSLIVINHNLIQTLVAKLSVDASKEKVRKQLLPIPSSRFNGDLEPVFYRKKIIKRSIVTI